MLALLVIALVVVPLLELVVIIQVGQAIGTPWTITLLVADSVLGAWLLRREGRRAFAQFREALADGRWPGDEVAQGAMVIVGGALLLTPGFLTDVVGFVLLLAPTRALLSAWLRGRLTPGAGGAAGKAGRRRRRKGRDAATDDGLGIEVVEIRREGDDPPPAVDAPDERHDADDRASEEGEEP